MTTAAIEDLPYRTVNGQTLLGRLYRPRNESPSNWIIDAHGGAWRSGDRLNNERIHRNLAAHGVGVFALDFRLSDVASYPEPVRDISAGIQWFRAHAKELGIQPRQIGGLGSSSGAQQLGLIALRPEEARWSPEDGGIGDASLDFFIACWPILDPLARYQMAKANRNQSLIDATHAYFPSDPSMSEGNPYLVVERGEATRKPPFLILQGTSDQNVEHERADLFADLYREHGGSAEVHKFEGQPHTFITANPDTEASKRGITLICEFARTR